MKKLRVLVVWEILRRKTDSTRQLTINEINNILQNEYNIYCDRNTLKRDIAVLEEAGVKIEELRCAHNTSCYYVRRTFKASEIRILLDSLGANKFVNDQIKHILTDKLGRLISERQRLSITSFVRIDPIVPKEIDMLTNLEKLHQAISQYKEVSFQYGRYDITKKIQFTRSSKQVIPKAIYFHNDRYYLIAYKEEALRHYRVDRMISVMLLQEHCYREIIDLKGYALRHFDMFSADEISLIKVRAKKQLMDSVIEKFGSEVSIRKDDLDHDKFIFHAYVGIGKGLVRWVLKQGKDMEVLEPSQLRECIKEEIVKMTKMYLSS
ncbi:helix-turn-helix transcriptional regulator [Cellulosilyticum sp. I15G10I2]|uniref:helix-turn-helix transcriptional regulator n=1 Tax=Cellulosilyticum sp. I15G10I2 TaxID=1892843 RepID=UPI00085BC164|nr:WYL domain-containing protein [Cellulosilyticum sp. I15G10I2]